MKIGIYWYSYADSISDAETEARACLAILNGRHIDLPVYFDMEEAWQTSLGMQTLTAMAERFCETIKQGGYKAGVYSNLNWFYNYLDYDRLRAKYSIWLAQWSGSYSLACDIWQNRIAKENYADIRKYLEDFFNYEEFGEYIAEEYSGQFTSCGFLYYDGNDSMSEIVNALDDEGSAMTMGGI